jgi:hypothetical protein
MFRLHHDRSVGSRVAAVNPAVRALGRGLEAQPRRRRALRTVLTIRSIHLGACHISSMMQALVWRTANSSAPILTA